MAGVINFVERQRQVYIYDFLVYVAGVDISPWVKDLSITYSDRGSPGSVDISISNPFDQWVLTPANFNGIFRQSNDRYTEKAKKAILLNKINLSSQSVAGKLQAGKTNTETIPANQVASPFDISGSYKTFGFKNTIASQQDFLQRYTFGPGSTVFSRFDTVKIFIKNPSDPITTDRWFPGFTGLVEQHPLTTNFVNGESTISLSAFDIRSTLQYMRISVNPYANDAYTVGGAGGGSLQSQQRNQQVFIDQAAAGFFKDYYPGISGGDPTRSQRTDNIFQGKSFVDAVSLITCGKTGWVNGETPVQNTDPSSGGVGFFQPGQVVKYANPDNQQVKESGVQTSLETWDNLCLFGTVRNADGSVAKQGQFLSKTECAYQGARSWWSANLDNAGPAYTPMNGFVHFLIPAQGLNISDMIRTSFGGLSNIMGSPEWSTRLSMINSFCETVDYQFSVTGAGDLIFEFPMYDFFPSDFGGNASVYKVDKHAVSENISDEGGEVFSAVEVQSIPTDLAGGQVAQQFINAQAALAVAQQQKAVAINNFLVAKYGVRIANKSITGVAPSSLHLFAVLELQKRLAEANKLTLDFSFRPWIRPNRPVFHVERKRIGKTTSVRLQLTPLRECTISASLGCVRTPLMKADGSVQFQHVFGGPGMALSYNSIFETAGTVVNNNSGFADNTAVPKNGN